MKLCKHCGKEVDRSKGLQCNACMYRKVKADPVKYQHLLMKHREHQHANGRSLGTRYGELVRGATKRQINVEIDFEQWQAIAIGTDCVYCSGYLDTDGKCGHRCDRKDNSKGYTLTNTIPCCGFCNGIKSDKLSFEETKAAIKAIIEVRKANVQESNQRQSREVSVVVSRNLL
jgi:hypothetical protein